MSEQKKQILIVEDSRTQALRLIQLLENGGYAVASAQNGEEALEMLRGGTVYPELIITDVMMPKMNGLELCRNIKSDPGLKRLPVIILTSLGDPSDVISGLECGADNFLIKPYEDDYLMSRVLYALANSPGRGDAEQPAHGVEVFYGGKRYLVDAERQQILDLLMSIYEHALRENKELMKARDALRGLNETLEQKVAARTAELEAEVATRKRAEDDLAKKAGQLAHTNRELEELLFIASHDLMEPLRPIAIYSKLLVDTCKTDDDSVMQSTAYIMQNVNRMDELLRDLRDYARIISRPLNPRLLEVQKTIERLQDDLDDEITACGARIELELLPAVLGDEKEVYLLFKHLIQNALKFRGDEPPVIHISAEPCSDGWTIRVTDNGIGIDPQYYERIFTMFKRLHRKDEYPGTGIGLTICKKIVEHHGGTIWVNSEHGHGSTFCFTLPKEDTTAVCGAQAEA